MTVAYYLILDNKRRKALDLSDHARDRRLRRRRRPEPRVDARQQALAQRAAPPQPMAMPPAMLPAPQLAQAGARADRRWHLGVQARRRRRAPPAPPPPRRPPTPSPLPQSSMTPADMMLEIFRTLRVLQFEWKIVAQYSLKCRPCSHPHGGGIDPSMAVRCKVKAGLQLYKIREDLYLLDIRKVDGDVLPFMDVCCALLSELRLNPPS